MKRKSLVEHAKSLTRKPVIKTTAEERELAKAWMRGEITLSQAARALRPHKPAASTSLYRFAVCFRDEYRAGRLTLEA